MHVVTKPYTKPYVGWACIDEDPLTYAMGRVLEHAGDSGEVHEIVAMVGPEVVSDEHTPAPWWWRALVRGREAPVEGAEPTKSRAMLAAMAATRSMRGT